MKKRLIKNKLSFGFTLIELLAVIIILGIVLVIAIPTVNNLIIESREKAYNQTVENIEKAAQLYVSNEVSALKHLRDNGDFIELTLQDLVNNNYLSAKIVNPITREDFRLDANMVRVTNNNGNFEYEFRATYIRTGLVADYRFDDFQEPTVNLVTSINPRFDIWGTPVPTGRSEIFTAPNGAAGVYANIVYSGAGAALRWRWTNNDVAIPVLPSTQHTVSAVIKWQGPSTPNINLFYLRQFRSNGTQITESGLYNPSNLISLGDGWFRAHATFTTNAETVFIRMESYQYSTIELWMYDMQIEQKPYVTPFVNGTRTGIVNDHSINNNDATLTLANTPRWTTPGKVGAGAYSFDGINDFIDTGRLFNFNKEDSFTVSFWINTTNHSHRPGTAAGLIGKGHWYDNTWDFYLSNGNAIWSEVSGNPVRNGIIGLNAGTLILNQWHHYVATYQNGVMISYLNGNLINSTTYTGIGNFTGSRNVLIGSRHGDLSRSFNGMLDDVRIYNRALSATEIRHNFDAENAAN